MREFEQMEMQYFVRPGEGAATAFEEWLPKRMAWYEAYGVTRSRLRFREHAPDELAHYAKKAIDVEYRFPFGWKELEGIHNRGDWDLGNHAKASGGNLEYFDPATEEHFIPWVVETAAGADRAAFTFLIDAYREEEVRGEKRVVLGIHPDLAPYKVAVLPLLKKRPEIVELCHRIKDDLKRQTMAVYDDTAAIGKLYRRQDEIGTPWCVTVDVDSLEDGNVTVRDRDAMTQERISAGQVTRYITDKLDAARPRGL
jgi:glycyl-tRNA synthetase